MEPIPEDLLTRLQEPDERALVLTRSVWGAGCRQSRRHASRRRRSSLRDSPRMCRKASVTTGSACGCSTSTASSSTSSSRPQPTLRSLPWKARSDVASSTSTTGASQSSRAAARRGAPKQYCSLKGSNEFVKPRATGSSLYRRTPAAAADQPRFASHLARRVKLLPGRRSRRVDQSLVKLRKLGRTPRGLLPRLSAERRAWRLPGRRVHQHALGIFEP